MERQRFTTIVGYDLNPAEHVLTEPRDVNSPLIATICVFAEAYGNKIIPIILRWLRNEHARPTTAADSALVVKQNADDFLSL